MGLFEYIKKMIQDAIDRNNTGSVSKGETKGVCGGAVYDAVKVEIEKHLEMPWVKVIDNDTTINFDDIPIEGPVEYAYVLADNEFFKHRFILLEVYEMAGGLIRSFIRASSLLSIDTLLEFSGSAYGEMVSFPKSGDTVEVFVGIVDDDGTYKFTISLESTGSTIYNDFRARARYID